MKLEGRLYHLTPSQKSPDNSLLNRSIPYVSHQRVAITVSLDTLAPVYVELVESTGLLGLFKYLLAWYHYLGFSGTVGKSMKYMFFDREHNPLACLLFGSAAWKSASRDDFIGWDADTRKANLNLLTNSMRFLILPWVRVPHLASYILGNIARRISSDWLKKYGHPIYLLKTFVERERFQGEGGLLSCRRNRVGQTKGRSRNDRYATFKVPIKDIYLYPLFGRPSAMKREGILAAYEPVPRR